MDGAHAKGKGIAVKAEAALCLFLLVAAASAQPLDWMQDMTIFGTTADERSPVLAVAPSSGIMRAVCVLDDGVVASKVSEDDGASWSAVSTWYAPSLSVLTASTADREHGYVCITGEGSPELRLFCFSGNGNDWTSAGQTVLATDSALQVMSVALATDCAFELQEPYLCAGWVTRDDAGHFSAVFAQSRDHGASFGPTEVVATWRGVNQIAACMSLAASWSGDSEHWLAAASEDRAGSIPEQIHVHMSDDQGATWPGNAAIDPSTTAQREPSIAAFGDFAVVVYTRESAGHSDVYCSFSVDAGLTFTDPLPVAETAPREHAPRAVMESGGARFWIFHLTDSDTGDCATLWARTGMTDSPWDLSEPLAVSGIDEVVPSGGLSVSTGPLGVAAAWTARFILGDTDVRFDASWRGSSVREPDWCADTARALRVHPNPLNSHARLSFAVNRAANVTFRLTDLLGRVVECRELGTQVAGQHQIVLDLSGHPSGAYFATLDGLRSPPVKVVLVR